MNKAATITTILLAAAVGIALSGCSNITASSAAANRYAIVIGVGTYTNGGTCAYADNDAYNMASLLKKKGWTVNDDNILISSSSGFETTNPTKSVIETTIKNLPSAASISGQSTVLVYFSGHGTEDGSMGYLVPYDGVNSSGNAILTDCISPSEISNWLGTLQCKNKIIILDSCYSGSFVNTNSSVDSLPSAYGTFEGGTGSSLLSSVFDNFGTLLQNSIKANGDPDIMTITASGFEPSWSGDSSYSDGVFTYYFLEAASNGDSDNDGYVTATEAYSYAKKRINSIWNSEYTRNLNYWQQYYNYYGYVPDFMPHISGGTGDLVLYVNN